VTLGRALVEVHDLDSAKTELSYVLEHAPENLAAIRAMAEIHHRRGELSEALSFYQSALELARHDPDLEQTIEEISRAMPSMETESIPAPALPNLERFLDAIHTYRQRRAV
jgi:tetratricopeptide (TPR) repeat protein